MQMKVVCKDLNDHFHQVFLGNDVFAIDDLFEDDGDEYCDGLHQVNAFELGQTDEVGTDEDTKVFSLHFAFLAVSRVAGMLETDPKLVHFDKVGEDEPDRIGQAPLGTMYQYITHEYSLHTDSTAPNPHVACLNKTHPSPKLMGRQSRVCPLR